MTQTISNLQNKEDIKVQHPPANLYVIFIIYMYPCGSFFSPFTGLLWHEDTFEAKAASCKPPGWFCAASEPDSTTWYPVKRYVQLISAGSGMNTCNYLLFHIPKLPPQYHVLVLRYLQTSFSISAVNFSPHVRVLIDLIKSKERENTGSFLPLQPPFGNDSMSAWERGDTGGTGSEKVNAGAPVRISLATVSKHRAGSQNIWYLLCSWCH